MNKYIFGSFKEKYDEKVYLAKNVRCQLCSVNNFNCNLLFRHTVNTQLYNPLKDIKNNFRLVPPVKFPDKHHTIEKRYMQMGITKLYLN